MLRTASFALSVASVGAHSWLTSPPPHNNNGGRGGATKGPCEGQQGALSLTSVEAGSFLSTVWPPMGHAGGFNRFALIPRVTANGGVGDATDHDNFEQNVLQTTCYGGGKSGTDTNGDPYRSDIQIPTNLADGEYTLQWWCYGTGNGLPDYYSCADLKITGGDPAQTCAPHVATTSDCWHCATDQCTPSKGTSGPRIAAQKSGNFCFEQGPAPTLPPVTTPSPPQPTPGPGGPGPGGPPVITGLITGAEALCYKDYTVKGGESMASIAANFRTTIDAIAFATGFEDDDYCGGEMSRTGLCPNQCQLKGQCGALNSPNECVCPGTTHCRGFNVHCLDVGHKMKIPSISCLPSSATSVAVGFTSLLVAGLAVL